MSQEWSPPDWMYRGRRPTSDNAYFENLARCLFQAGLSWRTVTNKWSNFRRAFGGFDVRKVAAYGAEDIGRLSEDAGIIRNRNKIVASIHNAREFERVAVGHGSFQRWLDSLDKTDNYATAVKQIISRFKHVGETTASIFLYTVGEDIRFPEMGHGRGRR